MNKLLIHVIFFVFISNVFAAESNCENAISEAEMANCDAAKNHPSSYYQPDSIDQQALATLKRAVRQQLKINPEFLLERALKKFEIKAGLTTFSNIQQTKNVDNALLQVAQFPTQRPKGVSADEWKALQNSAIDAGGENGTANYTLLDMNGDGQRDLIIDAYMGGTGLFNYISAIQRQGDQFVGGYSCLQQVKCNENTDENTLYSLNGRGANQFATWVKLQGRVYVAYRNSYFGIDTLYLLRPLYSNNMVPTLRLQYQYVFSIPKRQFKNEGKESYQLDDHQYNALAKALKLVKSREVQTAKDSIQPLCPIRANTPEDEWGNYMSYGPGHYSFEIVSDMSLWLDKTCYVAQLVNWFGAYSEKDGLIAKLWMRQPNQIGDASHEYQIIGKRKAIKIESTLAKFGEV